MKKIAIGLIICFISVSCYAIKLNFIGRQTQLYTPNISPDKAGFVQIWAGTSIPDGWHLCDGAEISRDAYVDLFSNIGTTYGTGDGVATFNIPDLRGIFVRGAGTSESLQDANGDYFSGFLGNYQNDKFQGHEHSGTQVIYQFYGGGSYWAAYTASNTTGIVSGTNGTPRIGNETNPANVSLNYIIKLYNDSVPAVEIEATYLSSLDATGINGRGYIKGSDAVTVTQSGHTIEVAIAEPLINFSNSWEVDTLGNISIGSQESDSVITIKNSNGKTKIGYGNPYNTFGIYELASSEGKQNILGMQVQTGGQADKGFGYQCDVTNYASTENCGFSTWVSGSAEVRNLGHTAWVTGIAPNCYGFKSDVLGATNEGYGGYFEATGSGAVNTGVYGRAVNGAINYAGYFNGDVNVTNFISTGSNEFLATDIERHTISSDEATAGYFDISWNKAIMSKIAYLDAVYYSIGVNVINGTGVTRSSDVSYDGSTIRVSDGVMLQDDIVTVYILYEK